MGKYELEAEKLFNCGCNCCQAVLLAFKDKINISEEEALRLSSSFGGGMGQLREVCGAVSGMFMVLGLLYGYTEPSKKKEHYQLIQEMAAKFKSENGSIVCRDLLNKEHRCVALVKSAARLLEEKIL